MRLLNGPWMTLMLLAPLIAVVGMAVLQVPAVDRARASTPPETSQTLAPPSRGDLKTEWWNNNGQAEPKPGAFDDRFRGATLAKADHHPNSARPAAQTAQSQANADDLFQSFNQRQLSQTSASGQNPIDVFRRDTATLSTPRTNVSAPSKIPAAYVNSTAQRFGVAHAGGFREVSAVNESQFNTRIDPLAQARAFAQPANVSVGSVGSNVNGPDSRRIVAPQRLTWRSAIARLNELGISEYRLEPGQRSHEFLFSCRYTPVDSPRLTRLFMAEAVEPLRAVEKVIAQVEQWKQMR